MKSSIPKHVAIIPDGNRRWARNRGLNPILGHHSGAEAVIDVVIAAKKMGIQYITFFAFSTENWKRSKEEVDAWMQLFALMLNREEERLIEEGVKVWTIGDETPLPDFVKETVAHSKKVTENNNTIHLILAVNYGARDELKRTINKLLKLQKEGKITELDENLIASNLDTSAFPDPELIIRTSGEKRLSNFLLWQASYSEYQAPDILWPDFRPSHLQEAITEYQQRQRRLGA